MSNVLIIRLSNCKVKIIEARENKLLLLLKLKIRTVSKKIVVFAELHHKFQRSTKKHQKHCIFKWLFQSRHKTTTKSASVLSIPAAA